MATTACKVSKLGQLSNVTLKLVLRSWVRSVSSKTSLHQLEERSTNFNATGDNRLLKYEVGDVDQMFNINNAVEIHKNQSTVTAIKKKSKTTGKYKDKLKIIKYPLKGMGVDEPKYTEYFESCKCYLESMTISTNELEYYPDIQEMSHKDIFECVEKLKEYKINTIFSLFLIQRIFLELTLEKTAVKAPSPNPKQWFKLRNGMYKLTHIRYVILYLELCHLLEDPYLDPNLLLERLAEIGVYDHLQTVTRKTKNLRLLGAKPEELMNNLNLYCGSSFFNTKIKLYQNMIGNSKGSFPVQLFLSSNIAKFKEKLHIGKEVDDIAKLLNVKEEDFLTCWSFKSLNTRTLVYKVQMCLKAGIPKVEVFNNIGILDRITVDQCHRVTKSLSQSGQPGSVFVLKALEANLHHSQKTRRTVSIPDWTNDATCQVSAINTIDSYEPSPSLITTTGDENSNNNANDNVSIRNTISISSVASDANRNNKNNSYDETSYHDSTFSDKQIKNRRKKLSSRKSVTMNKATQSSKVWRMEVFKLVAHLLRLDKPSQQAMYRADLNIDPTQLTDVTRNLDFMLSQNFTKVQLSRCPIVLAHPHDLVVRVERNLESMVRKSLHLVSCSKENLPIPHHQGIDDSSALSSLLSFSLLEPTSSSSLSSRSFSSSSFNSKFQSEQDKELTVCNTDALMNDIEADCNKIDVDSNCELLNRDCMSILSSDRVFRLNVLQYLLEKETNFSLSYAHTQSVTEFLN